MRNELKEKWMGLRRTLEMSAMKRRSNKHSDCWSRIWEVAARAFSRYIQDKAIANNMSIDYLVSLFPEELLADIQKETTPFALKEDMVAITPVFDAFFDTLQEKVDESGNTVLFSMPGDLQTEQSAADVLSRSNDEDISQMVLTQKATNQTEALKTLERLAGKDITNRETGIKAQINSTQRNKLVSTVALSKSKNNGFSFEDHFAAVANIDKLFENGTMVDDRADKSGDQNVVSIKRFVAPVLIGDDFAEAYITVKETAGNKVYSLELDELKKPSDITGGTLKERYHISEGYNKLLQKIKKARALLKNPENSSGDSAFSLPTDLGDTSLSPEDYRRSIDPLFDFVMEYTDSGIINPGMEHQGEDFTGSYISAEYKAYSEKRPQGRKESDASYQRYLENRERALNNALLFLCKKTGHPRGYKKRFIVGL